MSAALRPRKLHLKPWLLALLAVLIASPAAAGSWWQKDWPYRKQVTVNTGARGVPIQTPVGRAPILVRLHSGNFQFTDAQETGVDLRFTAADDKTPLAFNIESFDPATGVGAVWVDVPEFPVGSSKDIWLYYGNKKATPGQDSHAVFDPDYTLVWHFDGSATDPVKDMTAYGNNATTAAGGIEQASIIGHGARFTGTGGLVANPSGSLEIKLGGAFTFSAWVKPIALQPRAGLYVRRDGAGSLVIGLDNGLAFVEVGGQRIAATAPVTAGQWSQIVATADGKAITLYVNGQQVATGAAALPELNTATAIGGEAPGATGVAGFNGTMDEVRLSKVARSPALILADFTGEGAESKLVQYGADEKQSGVGFGYFGIIVQHVTLDAWVVIALLGLMAVSSWYVMWTKTAYVNTVDSANDAFLRLFRDTGGDPLKLDPENDPRVTRKMHNSSLFRLYRAASEEIRRRTSSGRRLALKAEAIEVIRALMDATLVRENQRLARGLVLLTISISGGPFLGLLGTVVGVMITFAAIAAAGDVNINAIAPGISAALLATVTGLAVAIPALFGYNYILLRNKNVSANMIVFIDEFITRAAEMHGGVGGHAQITE